ncbi:MAG TPA: DUF92 domain-containing protein [Candidatus Nitrosotalea sp.]|nr:DUF92 domain-containing protein [Candidatus Nitrosotalea sp.]
MTQIAVGTLCATLVAIAAYRTRALSASGALAAFGVGAIVFARGGWPAAGVLFAFFIPSTLLSRIGAQRKRALAAGEQHGPRNGWQVLANGGVAAACVLAGPALGTAFAGAFAAASADTWATEIGMLSRTAPFSILTLRPLQAGISGGVTPLGLAATLGGALVVASVASLAGYGPLLAVALGGVAGALLDSLAGASLQALRWCPVCECQCETRRHACGSPALLRRGVSWIENDAVNFLATFSGAAIAYAAAELWLR